MKTILSRTYLWLLLLFASSFSFIPLTAHAGAVPSVIATTPCDNAYYETLAARAWLEAQREITQNQNIILKPDSVLEYTCFDQLVWELADHADEMLSETSNYGTPLGGTSMDFALNNLVMSSIGSFFNANYGGYAGSLGGHPAALAIKHVVPLNLDSSSSYSCDIMERVWHAAKCINFITDANYDGFYRFEEFATLPAGAIDKRRFPNVCAPLVGNWNSNLISALTSGPWTNDPVQTYIAETTPESCSGASCPCSGDPIPTGLVVNGQSPGPATYDEYVCLQPGCRYHPGQFDLFPGGGDPGAGCYGR